MKYWEVIADKLSAQGMGLLQRRLPAMADDRSLMLIAAV
jgi:hypothetical protein